LKLINATWINPAQTCRAPDMGTGRARELAWIADQYKRIESTTGYQGVACVDLAKPINAAVISWPDR